MNNTKGNESFEVIGGADGPTSIFICDKSKKPTLPQRLRSYFYKTKRHLVEIRIKPGAHSLDEVEKYIKSRYGFVEVGRTESDYITEYEETRTAFLFRYRPDLVQGYDEKFDFDVKENVEEIIARLDAKIKKEKEIADSISREVFDIDFHKYVKSEKNIDDSMHILIEKNYGYLGGGAQGSRKYMKEFGRISKDIYKYYGVSEEDIRNKTERYKNLVTELSRK